MPRKIAIPTAVALAFVSMALLIISIPPIASSLVHPGYFIGGILCVLLSGFMIGASDD